MRKLASVQTITDIQQIEDADFIELATVKGWQVVIKKGEFKIGDTVIYCEIDSWIPKEIAPFMYKGKSYNGVEGEKLRTIKLKGTLSQGLILPNTEAFPEGTDLTDLLNIQKWEPKVPTQLNTKAKGTFPEFIPKTEQERVQNIPHIFLDKDREYEVTLKLDGTSMTVYWFNQTMGVCSRNLDLFLDQEGNTYINVAKKLFGTSLFNNIAIQGELMGPGIQGNRENLSEHRFFIFDIWDISAKKYYTPEERQNFCDVTGYDHVPIISNNYHLTTLPDLLKFAEQKSINNPIAEGIVLKSTDGLFSFKTINNKFLLKEK